MDINFDQASAEELMRHGIDSTEWASKQIEKELHHAIKSVYHRASPACPDAMNVFLPADAVQKLKTVCAWTKFRKQCRIDFGADWWDTHYSITETDERLTQIKAFEDAAADDSLNPPTRFTDMNLWEIFFDSLMSYLGAVRGAARIPLLYLFRSIVEVTMLDYNADYDNEEERYIRCVLHDGSHYLADNAKLSLLLKTAVENGPGWTYIRKFSARKNGRGVFLALEMQAMTA